VGTRTSCQVCFLRSKGPVMSCQGCGVMSHPECYGLSPRKGEDWTCQVCASGAAEGLSATQRIRCALCGKYVVRVRECVCLWMD
jgi:hypothetical protein